MNLALLGCAVALLHNSSELQGEGEHILIPQSLGKYGDAIMSWFNSIDAETVAMREALIEARIELQRWLNYDECDCPAEGHLCGRPRVERTVAKIDTVLKGGAC